MNLSTLNPKADPNADQLADAVATLFDDLDVLSTYVEKRTAQQIRDKVDDIQCQMVRLERITLVEFDVMMATLKVIDETAKHGLYDQERPLLVCVVRAVRDQIEKVLQ